MVKVIHDYSHATTQVDDFFDDSNFKVMNGGDKFAIVALEDSTVTLADGSTTVSLDKGES